MRESGAGDERAAAKLLLDPATRVTCPQCGQEFSLEQGFARKSLEDLASASAHALAQDRHAVAAAVQARLDAELAEKAKQIADLQGRELGLRKERAQLEDARQALELETQRRLDEQRREIEERVRAGEAERAKLREADLQKTIDDMRAKLEEAQRKSEQGSQQLQGEVLELILEEELAREFPLDSIVEVKKGVRGGDAIHTVMTRSGQAAGVILWEAKRTSKWGNPWPAKLKEDMRAARAEVGVIITTAFPPDWPQGQYFGLHEEVWVTAPAATLPLATVLRAGLLEAYKARVASANKGEKMEAVYDYLTSPHFAQKLRAVYDAFGKMRAELDTERTTTMQRWNRREKQIQSATLQLIGIAGDLQGLSHQDLPQLELESEPAGPDVAADPSAVDHE